MTNNFHKSVVQGIPNKGESPPWSNLVSWGGWGHLKGYYKNLKLIADILKLKRRAKKNLMSFKWAIALIDFLNYLVRVILKKVFGTLI